MSDLIYLKGTPKELKPIIMQIMGMYQLLESKDIGTIYETPEALSDRMTGRPEIQLVFREDTDFNKKIDQPGYHGLNRKKGRISFRLMDETSNTISKGELTRIGTKIKELFASNNGYVWEKGKELYSYSDWTKGYHFQILCRSKVQAKQLITMVLSIQNHTPDWKLLFTNENDNANERYPENPGTKVIAGEMVKIKKYRSLVKVRFQYAIAHLNGLTTPITLYDRRGKRGNPLVV